MTIVNFDINASNTTQLFNADDVEITLTRQTASVAIINVYNNNPDVIVTIVNTTTNSKDEHLPANGDDNSLQYPICHSDNYTIEISHTIHFANIQGYRTHYIKLQAMRGRAIDLNADDDDDE